MNLQILRQLFSLRDLRNALLGLSAIFSGLALAFFTIYAHRVLEDARLAGIAAIASLVLVLLIIVFVIPPLARSASAEASQMDLPFEFTTGGAVFLGLLAIVGFSAWNTGNNLLFLILAFLTSALIISFVIGNLALKDIDVKMRFPETIFAGQPTPILVSLNNRKRIFPTFSVVTEVRGKEREKSVAAEEFEKILPARWAKRLARAPITKHTLEYFVHIPRRKAVENKVDYVFPRRGQFIIKDFELSTRFPFAFFRHRRRLPAQEARIFIFPETVAFNEELSSLPLEAGKFVVQKRGMGQDLLSLRDYQPNDDLRRVDWKATARAQRIIVREFAAEDEKRVTVILDTRLRVSAKEKAKTLRERIEDEHKGRKTSPVSRRFEKGVTKAASLLEHFTEEKSEIRLIINDETADFGIGRQHLYENLKRLAMLEPQLIERVEAGNLVENLLEILEEGANSHIFLVSTLKEKDLPAEIAQEVKIVRF